MNKVVRTGTAYLRRLADKGYQIPAQVAGAVNYALDSYFMKRDLREAQMMEGMIDEDPDVHVVEQWIGCDIHQAVIVSKSWPGFAKAQNAWAFDRLFNAEGVKSPYRMVPFLDDYKFKAHVKKRYKIIQEPCQIAIDAMVPLPVHGKFFVENATTGAHLCVEIDWCYMQMACVISVTASPAASSEAAGFIAAFDASVAMNDIYSGKCLTFVSGVLGFAPIIPTTWPEVIMRPEVIEVIRNNTTGILSSMDKLATLGMCPSRNVMLISPPGMAKTTIFRAISNETDGAATRIWCTGKSIGDSYDVTSLFDAARSFAPCILIIEDMDLFGRDRGMLTRSDNGVLNEFLANLDGMQDNAGVIVMASTNDVRSMDEALVNRPGRFDVKVEIPYPDKEERSRMLLSFLKSYNAMPDESVTSDTWDNILELTAGLTGAYMKELAKSVVIRSTSNGGYGNGAVIFNADDLTSGADHVMKNFQIAKRAMSRDVTVDASVDII